MRPQRGEKHKDLQCQVQQALVISHRELILPRRCLQPCVPSAMLHVTAAQELREIPECEGQTGQWNLPLEVVMKATYESFLNQGNNFKVPTEWLYILPWENNLKRDHATLTWPT